MKPHFSCLPTAPLVALMTSLVGCYGYCILFYHAVDGFSAQLRTLLLIEEFHLHLFMFLVTLMFTFFAFFFCIALSRCSCATNKGSYSTINSKQSTFLEACDFVFVMDQSASIGDDEYKLTKKFAADLTVQMRIGQAKDQSQVGMVLFDRSAQVAFYLNAFTSNKAVYDAILNAGHSRGLTNISSGMNMALDTVFTPAHGNRSSLRNIMFVITDGSDGNDVLAAQSRAAQRGIAIFAIGIGKTVVTRNGKQGTTKWITCCCLRMNLLLDNPLIMALLILTSYGILIAWVLLLCFAAVIMALHFIFTRATYSFCSSIDNKCFDFTVLKPAISHMITNKNFDYIICQGNKEALCTGKFDFSGTFIAAFIMCLIALIGLINVLMCMIINVTRFRQYQSRSRCDYYQVDDQGKYSLVMNARDGEQT